MKNKILFPALLAGFLVLISCGGAGGSSKTNAESLSAALVVDGPIDDGSFNKSSWDGLQKAQKEIGYRVAYKQTTQPSEQMSAFDNFYEENYDIIIGIGYKTSDAVIAQANLNPDQKYAIVDFTDFTLLPPNILPLGFHSEQSSFLVGYIAGKMTKTGKVGFVGGIKGAIIDTFDYGFEAGVRYANPDIQVIKQYADSFADVAKGKNIAQIMYQNGADILYHGAGATGIGVIEGAKERRSAGSDVWVIGADVDQSPLAPEAVLISSIKDTGLALFNMLKDWESGVWTGGQVKEYGLAEGAVGIMDKSRHVPTNIMEETKKVKDLIISGQIVVPTDEASFQEFKNSY